MKTGRIVTVALMVFALVAIPLAVYVGGYLCLCKTRIVTQGRYFGTELRSHQLLRREYASQWQAAAFLPLEKVESLMLGKEVEVIAKRVESSP